MFMRNEAKDLKRDGLESTYRAYTRGPKTLFFSDFVLRLGGLPHGRYAPPFLDDATVEALNEALRNAQRRKGARK